MSAPHCIREFSDGINDGTSLTVCLIRSLRKRLTKGQATFMGTKLMHGPRILKLGDDSEKLEEDYWHRAKEVPSFACCQHNISRTLKDKYHCKKNNLLTR